MTLKLTDTRKRKITLGESIINRSCLTSRELAQFISNVVVIFEVVLKGPPHYRDIETLK